MAINTKRLMADALIALCDEMPLSKISVGMIVQKAGVGRQTFYNHFQDKNELVYWIFCRTLTGEKNLIENAGLQAYLVKLYREAQTYRRFLKEACKQQGQNSLSEAIYEQTYRYYKNYIIKKHGKEIMSDKLDYTLKFNAHGAANLYIDWAMQGMPGSADLQAQYALDCMPQTLKYLLE